MDSEPVSSQRLDSQWLRVRAILRGEIGELAFNKWIRVLVLAGVTNGSACLRVPVMEHKQFIDHTFLGRIQALWSSINPSIRRVFLVCDELPSGETNPSSPGVAKAEPSIPCRLSPHYRFDNFVTASTNEFAFQAARRFALGGSDYGDSPLVIYGPVGQGKTHLLHAIGHFVRSGKEAGTIACLSAEKFLNYFVRALRSQKELLGFKEQLRTVDMLLVDDVHFLAEKKASQEELLHTLNALHEEENRVALVSEVHPVALQGINEKLRSRLTSGLQLEIKPADREFRRRFIGKRAQTIHPQLHEEIIEYLADLQFNSPREIEGGLRRISTYQSLMNRRVDLPQVQELLQDFFYVQNQRMTVEHIQKQVAEYYEVSLREMLSARRARVITRPRQIAMYLVKCLTDRSLPEIGKRFGGRDHTTVIHAVRKIEEMARTDMGIQRDIQQLKNTLSGRHQQ